MDNAYSNDMVQIIDAKDNLSPVIPNNDSNNINENFSNENNKDNNGKKYDVWKKMKIITYLLFYSNIFYTILICIYFTLYDENILDCIACIFFIVFLGIYEIFYIMISFVIFCSEDKFFMFNIYEGFIIFFVPIIFWLSLNFPSEKFTITFQVLAISGSSLILLLSIIFMICTYKFIYCNKHINVVYIEFKV